jgi:dCMP deaminase
MSRPTHDQWAMILAVETAKRTTCLRRAVGAILLNVRGHVLATGYNGVASGLPHCNDVVQMPVYHTDPRVSDLGNMWQFDGVKTAKLDDGVVQCVGFEYINPHACSGAHSPSGTNLDHCQAIHAEQNALLQCRDVYNIEACYVTTSPCMTCVKLLLNTSCQKIYFLDEYSHTEAKDLWESAGREWIHMKM